MLSIRIKSYSFLVSTPYSAGHALNEAEAAALNALRAENIRNNMAKVLEKETAVLASGELLSPARLAEVRATVEKYDKSYTFPLRHRPRSRQAELEECVLEVAQERVEQQERSAGLRLTARERDLQVMSQVDLPAVQEEARRRLGERRQVILGSLEELI